MTLSVFCFASILLAVPHLGQLMETVPSVILISAIFLPQALQTIGFKDGGRLPIIPTNILIFYQQQLFFNLIAPVDSPGTPELTGAS